MAGQKSFSAQIDGWVRKSEKRMTAIVKQSAQTVALEVKAKTPVDTGFLRATFVASTAGMPSIDRDTKSDGGSKEDNDSQIALVIAGATIGQTIYFGFTAAYALRIEYGFSGEDSLGRSYSQEGVGMVRLAAQQWPTIVRRVTMEAKARIP